jgi:chitinase
MNKIKVLLPFLLLAMVFVQAKAQTSKSTFRIIGYMRNRTDLLAEVKKLDLRKITHLNIAFINPDPQGKLIVAPGLKEVTKLVHKKGVKVLLSIGGGMPPKHLSEFITGEKQAVLINALVKIAVDYNLDGIDVDLEGGMIDANYEGFVTNLAGMLKAKNKLITSAIATEYADKYTDKALAQFDFINVMCYDKTGPWRPQKPGQHAPYDMAAYDMNYWGNKRFIPREKLSLGVPFYGYGFGTNAPESMAYKDIIIQYPGAEDKDELTLPGGGILYYNGIPTIKAKTRLALKTAGGVMIWQLLQDAEGEKSLLGIINTEIKQQ